jgi:hypothetical protein
MQNQEEAKYRAANFYSPNNCATQFQHIVRNYIRQQSGGVDDSSGKLYPDDLIRVLASRKHFTFVKKKMVILFHNFFMQKHTWKSHSP